MLVVLHLLLFFSGYSTTHVRIVFFEWEPRIERESTQKIKHENSNDYLSVWFWNFTQRTMFLLWSSFFFTLGARISDVMSFVDVSRLLCKYRMERNTHPSHSNRHNWRLVRRHNFHNAIKRTHRTNSNTSARFGIKK